MGIYVFWVNVVNAVPDQLMRRQIWAFVVHVFFKDTISFDAALIEKKLSMLVLKT